MSNKHTIYVNGTAVEVSEEIHKYLLKSDRKIKYVEQDLKRNRYVVDSENESTRVIPKREESLDRLMEFGIDFPDKISDFRESVAEKIMLEKALEKLSDEERYLITQLFYFGRTVRELAAEQNVTDQTINNRKRKILSKLRKLIKK